MEDRAARETLCRELSQADSSLLFLLLFVVSLLISYWSTATERRRLCLLLREEDAAAAALPDTYPARRAAGILVVGALGFFLTLAWDGFYTAAAGRNCAARRSAWASLWAAILVMAASILRLWALGFAQNCLQNESGADSDLPD